MPKIYLIGVNGAGDRWPAAWQPDPERRPFEKQIGATARSASSKITLKEFVSSLKMKKWQGRQIPLVRKEPHLERGDKSNVHGGG
jgi:hypothetical protein